MESRVFYRSPRGHYPTVVRGSGVYLEDSDGKRYLDAASGALVANLGHGNAEVADALAQQARSVAFAHGSTFTTPAQEHLAQQIADLVSLKDARSYFVSGGSEATETAVKLVRQLHLERGANRRYKVVSRWGSYHGNTLMALSLSGHIARRRPYSPLLTASPHIAAPDCRHCLFCGGGCTLRCADALEDVIVREDPETVAAFIAEPISGSANSGHVPAPGYFARIREICDRHGVLLISDEVMTGFGRTGAALGIDHFGVVPDIVTAAKGLSAGYAPLGAVIVRGDHFETLTEGSGRFVHGFTYGGNPISVAVGAKVLEILQRDQLIERARTMGEYLMARLFEALQGHPHVAAIRGRGLMIGVVLEEDPGSGRPFDEDRHIADHLGRLAREHGLLIYPGTGSPNGTAGDHFLIGPPLIIERQQCEDIVDLLARSMHALFGTP